MNFTSVKKHKKYSFGGKHGDSFDKAAILEKSKHEIVVAVFAGFTTETFKG
jgi:hypothetical protein